MRRGAPRELAALATVPALAIAAVLWSAAAFAQGRIERLDALFERLAPSVVTVKVGLKRVQVSRNSARIDMGVGTSSGVLLHGAGYIATAAHVACPYFFAGAPGVRPAALSCAS